jgi:hypothetical protein
MFKLTVWGLCFSVFCSGEKSFFGGRANRPKKDYHHPDLSKKPLKNKKTPMIGGAIFLSPRDTLVVLVPILLIYFVH